MAATISFVISTTYFDIYVIIYVCCYDMLQCYYVVTFTLTKVQPPIPSSFLLRQHGQVDKRKCHVFHFIWYLFYFQNVVMKKVIHMLDHYFDFKFI